MSGEESERSQWGLWILARPLFFILSKMGTLECSEVIERITGCCIVESCGEARVEAATIGGNCGSKHLAPDPH